MKEAFFYRRVGEAVECSLCWHRCLIKPGRRGICGVRENHSGTLYSLVYGQVSAEHIDPVEKKPLFHFLPGSLTASIATAGCNFSCLHCQNHSLSQVGGRTAEIVSNYRTPEEIVQTARAGGCRSISYTYSEPTVFFEFAYDCCLKAKENGLRNVFVSNGYMSPEAARMIAPVLGAINIDIKSYSESFYRDVCGGSLEPVLENVRFFREQDIWVEVTTLIIPGLNDTDEQIGSIARFIASVDPEIAWHVSAFSPNYRMLDRSRTPGRRLETARAIGLETGLKYVYTGNIRGGVGENTDCPACAETLIRRSGFSIQDSCVSSGRCPFCSEPIAGVW